MDFTTIPWQNIAETSLILLCSLSFLAVIALPLMGIGGQTLSLIRQRTAYAKCAKQLTLLAVILGWFLSLASLWPLWLRLSPHILPLFAADGQSVTMPLLLEPILKQVYLQAHLVVVGLIWAATLCVTFYFALWKHWKNHRVPLQCLALIAACWYAMAAFGSISIISMDTAFAQGMAYPTKLTNFFTPNLTTSFWNGAPYVLPLAFSMGGGLGALWLIIRRNKDDFGRDYYAQMLPWCASWARNGWLIFWLILLATTAIQWMNLAQQENYLSSPEFMYSAGLLLLWIIPGVLWTLPMRSEHPLRHKATLVLAFIFGAISIAPIFTSL